MIFFSKLEPKDVTVRCGEWDLRSDDQEYYEFQDRKVDSFTIHPVFYDSRRKLYNDIALVHVTEDFDLADLEEDEYLNVAPICLPDFKGDLNTNFKTEADDCVSMGWGKKTIDAIDYEQRMKAVRGLPIVPNDECQETLRSKTRLPSKFNLHESFICAGGIEGKDTCEGDGGGPLVCRDKDDDNRLVQYFVQSMAFHIDTIICSQQKKQ